ncbi:MAG: Uma2 family endonuclease [Isosphaeraceae bacterium]
MIRGQPDDYTRRGTVPRAEEIGLVVEIADSSLRQDRGETLRTYARAGLATYWVVNLVSRRVEVFRAGRKASPPGTRTVRRSSPARRALRLDGAEAARIPARDLLPVAPV